MLLWVFCFRIYEQFYCIFIDIKFSPGIATILNLVKTKAVIPGCKFTSTSNILNDKLLWFKNGTVFQTHVTATPIVETNIFSFSNIVLKSTSFQDEGVYQCGIKVNGTSIILSDGIQLVVKGRQNKILCRF